MRSLMSVSPFNPARESLVAVFDEIRKKVSFRFFSNFSLKIPKKNQKYSKLAKFSKLFFVQSSTRHW